MQKLLGPILLFFLILGLLTDSAAADLSQADSLYEKGGLDNYKASIELYLQAVGQNPEDFEANWKCARAYREYAEEAKKKEVAGWKKICAEYGKAGMQFARKAIELNPDKPDGHYYYGLCVGIYSDGVSILTALAEGLKDKTRRSFEKAYELDKMYADAGPILAFGRFWSVLPWPFRDRQKALHYLREYQETPYFAKEDQAKIYLAEVLLAMNGDQNRREAEALLRLAAQSDEQYYSDWAKRLLAEMD
jgi:hypothetical protein